jgi:hypothetical protein
MTSPMFCVVSIAIKSKAMMIIVMVSYLNLGVTKKIGSLKITIKFSIPCNGSAYKNKTCK